MKNKKMVWIQLVNLLCLLKFIYFLEEEGAIQFH